jgi:hypothetical protein
LTSRQRHPRSWKGGFDNTRREYKYQGLAPSSQYSTTEISTIFQNHTLQQYSTMVPTAITPEATAATLTSPKSGPASNTGSTYRKPLVSTGSLDSFTSFEVTPTIGREYPTLQLSDVMSSPNRDNLIRDLAIAGKFLASRPSPPTFPALAARRITIESHHN